MIFTGDRKDKPEELKLSEEFFGGKKTAIEVTVKMLYGEDVSNVVGQYVRFCKVFNLMTSRYGYTEQAIQETIRICKDEDVLKAYLEEREKEVTSIMMALFSEEYIQKAYGKEKFDEGKNEGRNEGRIEGRNEGRIEGRNEGRNEGKAEGAGLMAKLAALLVRDGKYDAIIRASADEGYRNQLLKEYQLA